MELDAARKSLGIYTAAPETSGAANGQLHTSPPGGSLGSSSDGSCGLSPSTSTPSTSATATAAPATNGLLSSTATPLLSTAAVSVSRASELPQPTPAAPGIVRPSGSAGAREPDPDAIKMFVGQVPRSYDEDVLRPMFQEFGEIYQLNVLRDKATMQSRGCCFVTFYRRAEAIACQAALHNVKTLPGMHHPIQMKPADAENRNERKLFVGMLSKKCNEADVRQMFASYGHIEDCSVLRDPNANSKGCAFVTFAARSCAAQAIKAMHHSSTMEGCSQPLVVKFADTQKDKEQKKTPAPTGAPQPLLSAPTPQSHSNAAAAAAAAAAATTTPSLAAQMALLQGQAALTAQPSLQQQLLAILLAQQNAAAAAQPNPLAALFPGSGQAACGGQQSQAAQPSLQAQQSQQLQQQLLLQQQLAAQQQILAGAPQSLAVATTAAPSQGTEGLVQSLFGSANASLPGAFAPPPTGDDAGAAAAQNSLLAQTGQVSGGETAGLAMSSMSSTWQPFGLPANHPLLAPLHSSPVTATAATAATPSLPQSLGFDYATTGGLETRGVMGASLVSGGAAKTPSMSMGSSLAGGLRLGSTGLEALSAAYPSAALSALSAPSFLGAGMAGPAAAAAATLGGVGVAGSGGKQAEGPEGANLFIYHLPQEFTDADLAQTFIPFGNVISAKVFIDKQTNLSKCFGFVSYDSPLAANAAIQAMNGFAIGAKRLKVQLKRSKADAKPYAQPPQIQAPPQPLVSIPTSLPL